jgi:hypothetical protein
MLAMLSLNACSSSTTSDPSTDSTTEVNDQVEDNVEVITSSKTYNFTNGLYANEKFFIEQEYMDGTMYTKMYVDGDKFSMTSENEGSSSIMIMNDEFMYMLMPESMTAMMWPFDPEMEDENYEIVEEDAEIYNTVVNSGSEMIDGKNYEYEEFSVDGQGIKYYFDKDKLVYMKTFSITDGMEYIIKILDYGTNFDNSVFEVPEGYTIIDSSDMGFDMETDME